MGNLCRLRTLRRGGLFNAKAEVRHNAARATLRTRRLLCRLVSIRFALRFRRFSSLVDGLLNQFAGLLLGGVLRVQGGIVGCGLGGCFDALVILRLCRVSVSRVQVIDLLNGLNRLVLLSGALFSSSLFGGGLFSYLFVFCNNLSESVRRRTLRQLLGCLNGDGNHRLLRVHRHVTGRHLRHYRLLGLSNVLGSLCACRLLSFTLSRFTLCRFTCGGFLSFTLHTLRTLLRTLLTVLRKTLTGRGGKAHQTLTQVRALIRKTRQLTAAVRHQGAAQQHTESHAGTHRQRGMRRESQRLSANLRETTNTQGAVRNPAQPQGTKRGQNTGHHAQRHSRNQRRQRAEGNLQGNPLIQVVLTLTQEPPASNRTGSYRHQQAHQTERAHRLGHGTQNRKHRQGTSIATGQTNRSARTKGETGTGRPRNRINHQVRQETQLQQGHRGITHSARVQLLVGGNNL